MVLSKIQHVQADEHMKTKKHRTLWFPLTIVVENIAFKRVEG